MLPWHFVIDGIKANILFIYLFTFSTRVLKKSIDSLWKVCNKCEGDRHCLHCERCNIFSFSPILQDSKRVSRVRVLDRKKKANMQSQGSYYLYYILSVIKDEMQLEKQTNK